MAERLFKTMLPLYCVGDVVELSEGVGWGMSTRPTNNTYDKILPSRSSAEDILLLQQKKLIQFFPKVIKILYFYNDFVP